MSYDYPNKKYTIATADVDAVATFLAERQSDSGTTNGGIVASGSPAVPQLGVDASGLGLAYLKGVADGILCSTGIIAYDQSPVIASGTVGPGTSWGGIGPMITVTVPITRTYEIWMALQAYPNTAGGTLYYGVFVDGVERSAAPNFIQANSGQANTILNCFLTVLVPLSAGTHTLQAAWIISSGAQWASNSSCYRTLKVRGA